MAGWLSTGWEEAEEQAKQYSGGFTREFFLKSGEEARVRILDDAPVNIRDHFMKGEGRWITCTGELDCPLCASGNKAQNHFIFQVLDRREFVDKNGVTHQNEIKLWRVGIKLLRLLRLKSNKAGPLSSYDIEVMKVGEGQQTSYNIDIVMDTVKTKPEIPAGQERYNLEEILVPPAQTKRTSHTEENASRDRIPWGETED